MAGAADAACGRDANGPGERPQETRPERNASIPSAFSLPRFVTALVASLNGKGHPYGEGVWFSDTPVPPAG